MRNLCFDYAVQLSGDTVKITVPHHSMKSNGLRRPGTPAVPPSYTLEVLVDRDIYERLRAGAARIGVSYAGGQTPQQRLLARARLFRMCGITDGHETYPLPWLVLGSRPEPGMMADHINGDGLDNRRANLRWVTHNQNMQNRRGWGKMSRTMGVTFNRSTGKWVASVVRVCETREDAEREAQRMHALMYGPHARSSNP
jgi:hypothetical protein